MNHEFIRKNKLYPFDESFLEEGVFVLWKFRKESLKASTPTWHKNMLWTNNENMEFLDFLIFDESVNEYFGIYEGTGEVDYVILNSAGQILKTNFDAVATTDVYGVTKLSAESKPRFNYFVIAMPVTTKNGRVFYLSGSEIKELNRSIQIAILKRYIKAPKNYNKRTGIKTEFEIQSKNLPCMG